MAFLSWNQRRGTGLPARRLFRAVRRNDHVGGAVDIAQRRVQHRKRLLDPPRRKRVPDFDDQLAQLLLVGFGLLELGDKAFDLGLVTAFRPGPGRPESQVK
jgi:hypothetical protein